MQVVNELIQGGRRLLFSVLIPGKGLAQLLGLPDATDAEMQRWSQVLIDGAGNFGWDAELFADSHGPYAL